jgi:hypothetical protein
MLKNCISCNSIQTWLCDEDGDFTSNREQWKNRAWFRASIEENRLVFGIISSRRYQMTRELYGVYHGRFAAMLLAHFDTVMTDLSLTPLAYHKYDSIE